MLVAVGSQNPTKIQAVKDAFSKVFPNEPLELHGFSVSSGVSDQPMSDAEAITGARNRAQKALKKLHADYAVGLEGGMQEINGNWYESGWMVVLNAKGEKGIGSSVRLPVPKKIKQLIDQGIELGIACDMVFKKENTKHREGFFGLMTNNTVSRTAGYRDGVIAALSRFMHKELF